MRKSMKTILAALALATPLALTSCEGTLDDVFGEWDKPSANTNTNPGSDPTPSTDMTNKYRVWNGSDYDTPEIPSTAIDASTITTTINAGFYDVKSDVNLSGTITLAGDAEFVLRDGATLKIAGAIVDNTTTYNLKIYAQSEGTGMGKLDITNSSASDYPILANKLTVHGGEIIASNTGGTAVNLAGGLDMLGGKLTASSDGVGIMVYGGVINVVKGAIDAKTSGDGIAALDASGIDMIVLGGTVKATTSGGSGGCIDVSGDFTVYDGEIDAQATGNSYGIKVVGSTKKFTVSGGTITAKSGAGGMAAINVANEMEVNDGTINATAGADGEGIYVENTTNNTTTPVFKVSGGNITVIGGNATTGNGKEGIAVVGISSITGGTINTTGGDAAAGGNSGGPGFTSSTINFAGCTVVATGGADTGGPTGKGIDNTTWIIVATGLTYYEGTSANPSTAPTTTTPGDGSTPISCNSRYVEIK